MNRFELLSVTNSFSDTEAKEDDDNESSNKTCNDLEADKSRLEKQMSTESLKKKKKKKKKLRQQKSVENELNTPDHDDIEASINEVNKILGHCVTLDERKEEVKSSDVKSNALKLFCIEHRNLNPDNELKRIFGSKTVASEQSVSNRRKARGRVTPHRSWILANPRNLQTIGKPPINMQLVKTEGEGKDAELHFNFVHSKTYQNIQFQFFNAVESYNPENLVALLNTYPFHIDTLIQFSDVCRMGEDIQMAAELIERALHSFETILHPSFNVTQGNCRLDFRVPENRSFFIALFKHILFVGQRGCNRTALEFCKLLLGLDPNGDPLCVLQMIDFYAIRSGQFDYLVELYDSWRDSRKLWLFPNFRYSIALTYFLKSQSASANDCSAILDEADKHLKEALVLFPNVLLPLLDRCSVEPDSEVLKYPCFARSKHVSQSLQHLSSIFIGRNFMLWKEKETMAWMERNVREIVTEYKANDPLILDADEKYTRLS
ncbi:hypothetical protein B4U80_11082 [Leptotrombidium deliense]|uniref:Transcription factor 25-like protein n=1 Tax=Leptotrombidium deliense TaxID=299467 RepID=A0A443SNN8_9ACAR|nr:hypothetical protein B4U80_11082 [Leptotrombidium deliense]